MKRIGLETGHITSRFPWGPPYITFPEWLLDALSQDVRLGSSNGCRLESVLPGYDADVSPAHAKKVRGTLMQDFQNKTIRVPEMRSIRGHSSIHFLHEGPCVSWANDGFIDPLCLKDSAFLHRYLNDLEPAHLPGKTLIAATSSSDIFVHWLLDTVPQILQLMDQGIDMATFDKFVFTTDVRRIHQQVLDLLGVSPTQVHACRVDGPLIHTDHFTYVTPPRHLTATHPRNYELLRAFFGAKSVKQPSRRLYISRANAKRRRVLNEADLIAHLERRGFEVIRPEEHGIVDQAKIFSEASHIISPHGAALCNLIFAPPGTRVLEFFGAYLTQGYWVISNQMGHQYHAMECMGDQGTYLSDDDRAKIGGFMAQNGHDIVIPVNDMINFVDTRLLTK